MEFQSDYKEVVDLINKENEKESRIDIILKDIANMRCLFDKCAFSFGHRVGNKCAHMLAKLAVQPVRNVE